MLTRISMINFKSFKSQDLPLLPLTLLTGFNNSGKSSLIQALRMVWKWTSTGDPTLFGHGPLVEMQNIAAPRDEPITIGCTFENGQTLEMKMDVSNQSSTLNRPPSFPLPLLSYLSADRWGPRVSLLMNTALEELTHVGEHGEYVLDFLERHERDLIPLILRHPRAQGQTLKYNVDAWLEEISPNVKFSHLTDAKRDLSYATFDEFRPPNVGFGLSYTLPVIVILLGMAAEWLDNTLKTDRNVFVLLENPEAHLHPKCQTTMGKLIALTVAAGIQVIVETHSDHLMDGIRIAVKEGIIPAKQTAFHYFTLENGLSQVESPQLYDNGKLDYWPQGFFDQTMKNRAILARR